MKYVIPSRIESSKHGLNLQTKPLTDLLGTKLVFQILTTMSDGDCNNDRIRKLLKAIDLAPQELYNRFLKFALSMKQLKDYGFPVGSHKNPRKATLSMSSIFTNSLNPASQTCRCGKSVSLLVDNWYFDENGCSYHSGKRVFSGGADNGQFSCCQQSSEQPGCTFNKHHVSFFRPLGRFVQAGHADKNRPRISPSNIFALDCEMAFTTRGMEVVKVSLVGIDGSVVYDSYVRPESPILDYNTPFSGVDDDKLQGVLVTLADVQKSLLEILNTDSILVGHGLENDLIGLNVIHKNIVDTSFVFPHERGFPLKHSLKNLAMLHLNKQIQGEGGHNSIEDARTCMELVLWKISSQVTNEDLPDKLSSSPFVKVPPFYLDPVKQPNPLPLIGKPPPVYTLMPWTVQFETPVLPIMFLPTPCQVSRIPFSFAKPKRWLHKAMQ